MPKWSLIIRERHRDPTPGVLKRSPHSANKFPSLPLPIREAPPLSPTQAWEPEPVAMAARPSPHPPRGRKLSPSETSSCVCQSQQPRTRPHHAQLPEQAHLASVMLGPSWGEGPGDTLDTHNPTAAGPRRAQHKGPLGMKRPLRGRGAATSPPLLK